MGQMVESYVPYPKRVLGAANYIKMFGVPEFVEYELRDQSKYVQCLDPDIACKKSWSMSVKIMTQKERNYQKSLERINKSEWQQNKRNAIKTILGFEWPF
jgi:hypothetical protein